MFVKRRALGSPSPPGDCLCQLVQSNQLRGTSRDLQRQDIGGTTFTFFSVFVVSRLASMFDNLVNCYKHFQSFLQDSPNSSDKNWSWTSIPVEKIKLKTRLGKVTVFAISSPKSICLPGMFSPGFLPFWLRPLVWGPPQPSAITPQPPHSSRGLLAKVNKFRDGGCESHLSVLRKISFQSCDCTNGTLAPQFPEINEVWKWGVWIRIGGFHLRFAVKRFEMLIIDVKCSKMLNSEKCCELLWITMKYYKMLWNAVKYC